MKYSPKCLAVLFGISLSRRMGHFWMKQDGKWQIIGAGSGRPTKNNSGIFRNF
jgi:hypothetical protein